MPTYEYGCSSCGKEWEEVQRITEAPLEVCPSCGKPSAHRLISAGGGFILKGGGWYSDLYSSPKAADKTAESGSTAPAAEASGATTEKTDKADAKPASAPAPAATPTTPAST